MTTGRNVNITALCSCTSNEMLMKWHINDTRLKWLCISCHHIYYMTPDMTHLWHNLLMIGHKTLVRTPGRKPEMRRHIYDKTPNLYSCHNTYDPWHVLRYDMLLACSDMPSEMKVFTCVLCAWVTAWQVSCQNSFLFSAWSVSPMSQSVTLNLKTEQDVTHSISLLHEVLPADVRHDSCSKRVSHYVHHSTKTVPNNTRQRSKLRWTFQSFSGRRVCVHVLIEECQYFVHW